MGGATQFCKYRQRNAVYLMILLLYLFHSVQVDSEYIPDISAQCPLCISGKYQGKFPETVVATGYLAAMIEISIELKVQHITDMPLDNVKCSNFATLYICLIIHGDTCASN